MEDPSPPRLEVNGKCLAYHGPLLYEAKILKTHQANSTSIVGPEGKEEIDSKEFSNFPESFMGKTCFYVHYKGWKPKWDEWVTVERLLVLSTDNLQLQKDLKNRTMQKVKKPQKAVTPKLKAKLIATPVVASDEKNSNGKAKQKRIKDCVLPELLKQESKEVGFEICVSVALKELLVDDWERITKENKLISIPSNHPVKDVLNAYQAFVLEGVVKHSAFYDNTVDFFQGLRVYFNTTLSSILLYQFERKQLKEMMNTYTEPIDYSSVYGPIHLLRLLVTLPSLIPQTKIDGQSLDFFKTTLDQLLLWLHKNIDQYFVDDYINTSPSYEALARI